MSEFGDIARAYSSYRKEGSWENVRTGLIYTCNGGWIDLGHLNPYSTRPEIGAANLWRQVRHEGSPMMRAECQNYDLNIGYAQLRMMLANCKDKPHFQFKDGKTGYKVRYRQDHGNRSLKQVLVYPHAERRYVIKHGLNMHEKRAIALAIFMKVSLKFESKQRFFGLFDTITDSGFSQEDLVSNLVGFYIALNMVSKVDAIALLNPVSQELSEHLWRTNGSVGSHENHTFDPQFLETYRDNDIQKQCEDECMFQKKRLPDIFRSIQPADEGTNFIGL